MNAQQPGPSWTDERLDAAFAERAAGSLPTPSGLVDDTIATAARSDRRRATWPRARTAGLVAASLIVAVVLGVSVIPRASRGPQDRGPSEAPPVESTGAAAASPTPDSTPSSPTALPRSVTIEEAISIRDRGVDPTELAVSGYLSPWMGLPCPYVPADPNPSRVDCPDSFQYLMAAPESLTSVAGGATRFGPPSGPALNPSFKLVEQPFRAAGPESTPVPAVLVGHFDDRRAALCADPPPAVPCDDVFVVDQVESIDGRSIGATTTSDLEVDRGNAAATLQPVTSDASIDRLVAGVDPDAVVLSRRVVAAGRIATIEPALRGSLPANLTASAIWSVVVVDADGPEPAVARTYLIGDGRTEVFEMTAGGPVPAWPFIVSCPFDPGTCDGVMTAIQSLDLAGQISAVNVGTGLACPGAPCVRILPGLGVVPVGHATVTMSGAAQPVLVNLWTFNGVIHAVVLHPTQVGNDPGSSDQPTAS